MFENFLAERMGRLHTESAFQILAEANALEAQGRSVIHCEIGQPDFATPDHIIEAAYEAMKAGYTGYSPSPGYPDVRAAIAREAGERKGLDLSPDNIIIVPGGKPIMFFTMLLLVSPGDEVLYPNPGFPIYESCIRFAGGKPVPVPLLDQNDFRIDLDHFRASITPKTKLVIINNPGNPTGGLMTRQDIEDLASVLRDRPDIMILSDEIYDRLVFGEKPYSIAAVPGFQDRTIILDGFSKAYAMTGWRIGYGIMHPELAKGIELLMVNSNSCTASFTQRAALAAVTGPQEDVSRMRDAFRERRDWVVPALNEIPGITCRTPGGAFYAFPNIESFGIDSHTFCTRLLREAGVAAAWGTSFGSYGEGHFRLSFANSLENLKIAVDRIAGFAAGLR